MELSTRKRLPGRAAGTVAVPLAEFDEYRLLRPLRVGGDTQVYLAQDTLLDRLVAVKFFPAPDRRSLERFLAEARAAARIQHPNIATLYRVGQAGGAAYLVSEYVRGRPLQTVERPVAPARALEIACDLARGLGAAHRRGVLHCDLNVGNVLVTEDDQIKIVDFGLARLLLPTSAMEEQPERPLFGTADHIPPEAWRGEELTVRSDLYSLGVIAFDLCAGRPPFHDVPPHLVGHAVVERDAPALGSLVPDVDPRFAASVDRCLRRDPKERFATADDLLDALERARPSRQIAVPEGNPYRGLQAFQPEHRAVFFGRSRDCLAVVERLRSEPFVLVAGDSGVGKSSLCLAGIVPSVADGALGPARTWRIARLVPGRRPLAALASALVPQDAQAAEKLLRDDPAGFARKIQRELEDDRGVVIFVDQLEELITLGREEAPATAAALAELAAGYDGIRLLATSRNDFLGPLTSLPCLGELVPRALYLLRGLSEDDLCEAIAGPAGAKGFRFESDGLVRELAAATATALGGLPLLQFMLSQVWEARDRERGIITAAGIDALGGVAGALARHADTVLAALVPTEREAARQVLLRLATPELTRTRHSRDELTGGNAAAQSALEALVRGRLLVVTDGESVELAHEALLTAWGTLARWVKEQSGQEVVRQRVEAAAAEWVRAGHDSEALWGARRLPEARVLEPGLLSETARDFLGKSHQAIARAAWRRRALAVAILGAVAALAIGSQMLRQHEIDVRVAGRLAEAKAALLKARAEASALASARSESFALFDAREIESAERTWSRVLDLRTEVAQDYASASRELETAFSLDGSRKDVRSLFADVLLDRAYVAEDAGRLLERDELVHRLALFDEGGDRRRRWSLPATLAISSKPEAAVEVQRYVSDARGHRRLEEVRSFSGSAELGDLESGSYLVVFRAKGRAPVNAPVRLGRGERFALDVELPAASSIPDGFVYVPPGRFLFGSAASEEQRRSFYKTVPIHDRSTAGYLIARHETTFADWIAFLEALPPKERARRVPRVARVGFTGALELKQDPGGKWRLTVQPTSRSLSAREGEVISYPSRKTATSQDWLNFPVSGISSDDARAYAAWLAQTGKVPNARLCDEVEWERAARGADGRQFPHGDALDPDDANIDQTYGKQPLAFGPDTVGLHPASRSPFGVDDLAGNVWEWASSALVPGESVVRGGSFYHDQNSSHSENREVPEASIRDLTVGMRVCASVSR